MKITMCLARFYPVPPIMGGPGEFVRVREIHRQP